MDTTSKPSLVVLGKPKSDAVFGLEPGVFGDSCKHLRSDILAVVKGEDVASPAFPLEDSVRIVARGSVPSDLSPTQGV
jgi:hypothetical protein